MKKISMNFMKLAFVASLVVLYSCGGTTEPTTETTDDGANVEETTPAEEPGAVNEDAKTDENTEIADLAKGKEIYAKCVVCHQENGKGMEGAFPPLANSDYLLADTKRAISEVLKGKSGEVVVNGATYNSMMPANVLTDEETVAVMNYILNSWGNDGGVVTLEDVAVAKE